jgi:ribonucleoside-diphosphate reductase alpha subunit
MNMNISDMNGEMYVLKRDGRKEVVAFEKVSERLRKVADGLQVNVTAVAQKVLAQIVDGIKTSELDELAANLAISNVTVSPDYGVLASRIIISNHQKNTPYTFAQAMDLLHTTKDRDGRVVPIVSPELAAFAAANAEAIEARIDYERDFLLDFFGFKTLEKAYLLRDSERRLVERPQHMWMRVSLGLWLAAPNGLERAFETYDMMSRKLFTHATPTLFNCGTPRQQLSSCFLLALADDSIAGIYKTLTDCAMISKYAGGIGLHIHNVRAKGAAIRGTNGTSNGIVPMLRNFNATARYVDQCFTPDTLVYTQAGPKPIEDVSITDSVLTSEGVYHKVMLPVRHEYTGKMLEIQSKSAVYPVRVTPEHQVMALTGQAKGLNFDVIRNRLDKNLAEVKFYDAKELNEGDFLVYPIPTYEADIAQMTEEDCRMYGILLGDGHISSAASGVALNTTTKQSAVDFVRKYLGERGVNVNEYTEDNCLKLKWSSANPGFKFTRSQLYDSQKVKHIEPAMLHLPLPKIKQIIRGLLETDGCIGEKEISIEVTSYSIIESLRYMLLRLGALSSGYERNRVGDVSPYKNITTRQTTAVLRIPRIPEILEMFPNAPESRNFTFMRHGDRVYSRIQTITEVDYSGVVHDFEIAGPHDYVVSHLGVAHNGGGKRNGSFAIYLEPWHADIQEFLRLKLNNGSEEERARDLFYALWLPDLFMERVRDGGNWTLFCPSEAPGLADVVGDEFKALYERYEAEGRGRTVLKAQKLWFEVLDSQIETGTPYLVYKDAANKKSNQQNVGVIKSSNLCSEIIEYSSPEETAVCNLASMALPTFVRDGAFDFVEFRKAVSVVTRNLNRVIDINYYPTPETERSNMRHRPIGLGVQGLADVFALLRVPWEITEGGRVVANPDAILLNKRIFAHMYYAAVSTSAELALVEGPYSTFAGSPASKGQLQFDLWGQDPIVDEGLDWVGLRARASVGLRNSLLLAPMPTASTSQILGFNECFEPFTTNIYTRRTLAGEFIQVNKYLVADLVRLGVWSPELKDRIIARAGSVQGIAEVPAEVQALYKTVWELKQKTLIDLAADRGAYICQSQSLNLFVPDPDYSKLTSMHFYAWQKGLKTGIYYLRTKAPVAAQQFTIDPTLKTGAPKQEKQPVEDKECLMCSA